jgi:uncharacterized YigZ family protein
MEKKLDQYLTISAPAEGVFKDKGSKFMAFAYPVNSEDEIKALVIFLKKEHYSARHHCYAWRLGPEGEHYRSNDDGEPSGTAGRPILGQLLSAKLTYILVVVVRYFGGTLLGVSGLINAYKNAAADAIDKATVVEKKVEHLVEIIFGYPGQNQVMKAIKDEQLEVVTTYYGVDCRVSVWVRLSKLEKVIGKLSKIEGVSVKCDFLQV